MLSTIGSSALRSSVGRNMSTRVMKFGGSSVGSASAMRRVGDILIDADKNGVQPVGVLSAIYAVTNKLVASSAAAQAGDAKGVAENRASLWALHERTARDLLGEGAEFTAAMDKLQELLAANFDATIQDVLEAGAASTYHTDVITSVGERLSNELLSAHLRNLGFQSTALQADQLIVTDGVSGNSMPLLDETQAKVDELLRPLLGRGSLPLVTGFFGASVEGKLTTLGRGGSDLTAATVGYCLNADAIDLFKVEYTTNEATGWMEEWEGGFVGVVHDADVTQTIPELDYKDARELAHFGKKVLHPETVAPAVAKNIPIFVKNTMQPQLESTVIRRLGDKGVVNALTKVAVGEYESKHSVSLLEEGGEDAANVLVALVGEDICSTDESQSNLEEACQGMLEAAGIASAVPDRVNGSSHNFSLVVPASSSKQAVKLLHNEFVAPQASVEEVLSNHAAASARKAQL